MLGKRIAVKINWPNVLILIKFFCYLQQHDPSFFFYVWAYPNLLDLSSGLIFGGGTITDSYSFNNASPMD